MKMNPLDGMTFVVETGEAGKTKGNPDEISFKDGKLHSKAGDSRGFGEGVYLSMATGNTVQFQAETVSEKEGKIQWKGTVQDGKLTGNYTWHPLEKKLRLRDKPVEYWVKGEVKP
jgi:hypothetical protein